MKKILTFSLLLFIYLCSCKNQDKQVGKSENDIDAARNFVQAALYGKYDEARTFMLRDSINEDLMNLVERQNLSQDERRGLAGASINIHTVKPVNDSITIVIYSNSFKNNWDTLKVLKIKGQWLVDFKYLFDHDNDTLMTHPVNKPDSTK